MSSNRKIKGKRTPLHCHWTSQWESPSAERLIPAICWKVRVLVYSDFGLPLYWVHLRQINLSNRLKEFVVSNKRVGVCLALNSISNLDREKGYIVEAIIAIQRWLFILTLETIIKVISQAKMVRSSRSVCNAVDYRQQEKQNMTPKTA